MKILLSGFEPFGEESVNPSSLVIDALSKKHASRWTPHEIYTVVLPVTFDQAFQKLEAEIRKFDPDVVVALGLAGGRSDKLELERVAINCIDAFIPDNSGHQPRDEKIDALGREAYFSTLPIHALAQALNKQGIPARLSNSAGTYVCNYLFYKLQEVSLRTRRQTGFIHVPYFPEQAAVRTPQPGSMTLEKMIEGVELIVELLARGLRNGQ
jgi:pyroglutamyl-peptidase